MDCSRGFGQTLRLSTKEVLILAYRLLLPLILFSSLAMAQVSVTTEGYDNSRTGANLNETVLNTLNVNTQQFGKLFSQPVDGAIYAQPLYVPNVMINGASHNVVYLATMNDVVYAFDADNNTGANAAPLWKVDFRVSGALPVPSPGNIIKDSIGIESTPVIDLSTNTMYLVAYTFEGASQYVYRLHALDIASGAEKFGGPVVLGASIQGTGAGSNGGVLTLSTTEQMQRMALGLANGMVFVGFGAFGDLYTYHGWLLAYNAKTLQQVGVVCTTPNGYNGSIWMSGRGPVIDSNNNLFVQTSDGLYDGNTNFGDSFVKFSTIPGAGLSLSDWFTPDDFSTLDSQNWDLGASGPLLIPGTNLLVGADKTGMLYVVNSADMGHEWGGNSQIVQSFGVADYLPLGERLYTGPAYYNRNTPLGPWLYIWPLERYLTAYRFNGTKLDSTPISQSTIASPTFSYAAGLAVSSNNGTAGSGIVWAYMPGAANEFDGGVVNGIIRAFNADDLTSEVWDSGMNPARDAPGLWSKFRAPVVANGKVYVGSVTDTANHIGAALSVYGLLSTAPDFAVSTSTATSSFVPGGTASYTVNVGALNGFVGTIGLTVSGLPAGAFASFTPGSISGSGSSTLTITTSTGTPAATSLLTITGTSGSLSHIADVMLTPPIAVSPSPASVTLSPNETQQFTAIVQNSTSQSVTWSINPALGTITQNGLYTSPDIISTTQPVTVTATSVADATRFGTATITLSAGIGSGAISFISQDSSTQGSWHGVYGADGYWISQDSQSQPKYGTAAVENQRNYTWASSTSDPRALQTGSGSGRIASTWYSTSTFSLTVNVTDGNPHQVALYLLDWDSKNRAETVQVVDAASGIVLDTRPVSNFSGGVYLLWNVWGSVVFNVTDISGPNSVVSGLFFDPSSAAEKVLLNPSNSTLSGGGQQQFTATVTNSTSQVVTWSILSVNPSTAAAGSFSTTTPGLYLAPAVGTISNAQVTVKAVSADGTASATALINLVGPSNTAAAFVSIDSKTQGNWQSVYGSDGYDLASLSPSIPGYATFALNNQLNYIWNGSTADPRALRMPGTSSGIAATWYSPTSFSFDFNAGANPHQLAIYAVDWDNQGRSETVQILDANTNASLNVQNLSNFSGGAYLIWNITGHVKITITANSGPNAVISGVFFGAGAASITAATASFVSADTATQGSWLGVYGSAGFSVAGGTQTNPTFGSISLQNQLNWTWAATTTDPRALEVGGPGNRVAATWYNASTVSLDINLTDGQSHQVALYLLDWDSKGRNETIQIQDANLGTTLDSRTVPAANTSTTSANFIGGSYLIWKVKGHIKINILSNAGPNAVVSGIFID
jgi:hypothetical protein